MELSGPTSLRKEKCQEKADGLLQAFCKVPRRSGARLTSDTQPKRRSNGKSGRPSGDGLCPRPPAALALVPVGARPVPAPGPGGGTGAAPDKHLALSAEPNQEVANIIYNTHTSLGPRREGSEL